MTRHLLAAVLVLPLLAGCGAEEPHPIDPPGHEQLPAGDFVAGDLPAPFGEGDQLRASFTGGQISFRATCNTLSGDVALDGDVLMVSQVGGTEMGCPGAGHEQDEWLVDFFTSSPEVSVDGTDVRLATEDAEIWLVPADEVAPDPGPDAALEGTRWELTGVEETEGDSVGMLVVPRRLGAGLEIDGDRILFDTGCNDAGGRVQVHDDRLRLRGVAITLKGCPGIRQEVESAQVPLVMSKQVRWSIDGDQLRLGNGRVVLLYTARR